MNAKTSFGKLQRLAMSMMGLVAVMMWNSGCATTHARNVQQGLDGDRLTVANVQSEVRKGMSGGEVVEALGSPNIVTTDENGWEVWVYDRIATDVAYSRSAGSVIGLLVFGSGEGSAALAARRGLHPPPSEP